MVLQGTLWMDNGSFVKSYHLSFRACPRIQYVAGSGIHFVSKQRHWIPAFAGMTALRTYDSCCHSGLDPESSDVCLPYMISSSRKRKSCIIKFLMSISPPIDISYAFSGLNSAFGKEEPGAIFKIVIRISQQGMPSVFIGKERV